MSEDNDLIIRVKLDRSQAKAERAADAADQKKLEQRILADSEETEKAKALLAKQAAKEKIAAIAETYTGEKARSESAKRLAEEEAAVKKKAVQDEREARRQANVEATEAERTRVESAKRAAAAEAEARKATAAAEKEGAKAAEEHVAAIRATEDGFAGMVKQAGAFSLAMLGLDSIRGVLSSIVGEFEKARDAAFRAVAEVSDYREQLLSLAALKGHGGDTTEELKEQVAFRNVTLQKRGDAAKFLERGESLLGGSVDAGLLSAEEKTKLLAYGGKFQAFEGGDADAHARLLGMMPSLSGKQAQSAESNFAREQQIYEIFKNGGFTWSEGARQYSGLQGEVTSGTYDEMELAGLLSAFSKSGDPTRAQEKVKQFTRATLGGIDKKRGAGVEGAEKQGEYLRGLGVDEQFQKSMKATDLPFAIGARIAADLKAQQKAQGASFSADVYLRHKGFANMEDIGAIKEFAGLQDSGILKSFQDKAHKPVGFDEAIGPVQDKLAHDPAFQKRRASYAEEMANLAAGAGRPETLDTVRRMAFAKLRAEGKEDQYTSYDDLKKTSTLDPFAFSHRHQVDFEAQDMLIKEAAKLGIAVDGRFVTRDLGPLGRARGANMSEDELFALAKQVQAKGGNVLPGAGGIQAGAFRALGVAADFANPGGAPGAGEAATLDVLGKIEGHLDKLANRPAGAPVPAPGKPAAPAGAKVPAPMPPPPRAPVGR